MSTTVGSLFRVGAVAGAAAISTLPICERPVPAERAPSPPLTLITDVPLPGSATRFDYQSFDATTGRLYVSHMGGGTLLVFDAHTNRVVADLPGFPSVTGVLSVPSLHRVYASVTGRHELVVIDDRTLAPVARIGGIQFPDGIAYDSASNTIFVSDESGRADVAIDAAHDVKLTTIALGGEAGNTHVDPRAHRILVAVQTRNELVAIDPITRRVTQRFSVPCDHPHGFTLDPRRNVAFVSCEGDGKLLVVDLATMRTTATFGVGDDPDVLALDEGNDRLYVASESGRVSVFAEDGASLRPLGSIEAPHAHSVAVDPATHRVFLPLQNMSGHAVMRIMAPTVPARS